MATQSVTGTVASFGVVLDVGGGYEVNARTRASVSSGPAAAMGIISAAPSITAIATSATTVVATLATISGISNYQASLYKDDQRVAGPTAAVTSGATTTVTFTYCVLPQASYSVRAQAIGASAATQSVPQRESRTQ